PRPVAPAAGRGPRRPKGAPPRGRPREPTQELAYTSHAKRLIETASKEAREAGTGLSAEQLMLAALLESRGAMGMLLAEVGADADRVRSAVAGPDGSGS